MEELELSSAVFLHSLKGVGNRRLWRIKKEFKSFRNCVESPSDLLYSSSLPVEIATRIIESRKNIDLLANLDDVLNKQIKIITIEDEKYPTILRDIVDHPYLLYYRGNIDILSEFAIAIVGSRSATAYGINQARRFARELAARELVIISGMARGIDTAAHQGSLEVGGKTVAVLGSGLDVIYPAENKHLYNDLCDKGLVLSEFGLQTRPEPGNFPARNRIISGLSHGVLVVEAKKKSGALITVDFALEQGRDVFAIPGPVSSANSEGTNHLIKQGAGLVTCPEDILQEFYMYDFGDREDKIEQGELFTLDKDEERVLECMGYDSTHFDELLNLTGIDLGLLSKILLKMELKGIIRSLPGNHYIKNQ